MTKIFLDPEIFCARIQRCAIHLSNEVNIGFSLLVNNHQSRGVIVCIAWCLNAIQVGEKLSCMKTSVFARSAAECKYRCLNTG